MCKSKRHSESLVQSNIACISKLFPGCLTESFDESMEIRQSINFDHLKQELSEFLVDGTEERYRLDWPGKRNALIEANRPTNLTLRPQLAESINFETTQNLFIEGNNLDVLKLLKDTYLNKVKIIYIDPPYNTGNDFIYKDKFATDSNEYLELSSQKSKEGYILVANRETSGRFHSDWLTMMYPRLKLARNLLSPDGVIFVSIGVEELANLKKLMDEIFGESNFIEIFSWVKTSTPPGLSDKTRKTNEYILCYEKSRNSFAYRGEFLDGGDQPLLNKGNKVKEIKFPKDKVFFKFLADKHNEIKSGKKGRVKFLDDIKIIDGYSDRDFTLSGEFKWTQDKLNKEIMDGTTFIIKSKKFSIRFIRSDNLNLGYKRPTNFIKEKYTSPLIDKQNTDVETNEKASKDLRQLTAIPAKSAGSVTTGVSGGVKKNCSQTFH